MYESLLFTLLPGILTFNRTIPRTLTPTDIHTHIFELSGMDALSVTASVAGLLQVAAKVISVLSSAVDASATARNVLAEVESLLGIFRQLDDFVVNFADQSMARKSRIYVDDLVVALTGCVCTFSELDRELEGLRMDDGAHGALKNRFGAWRSVKWAVKDQDIAKILRNLQMHKTSLNLLLSIYTWLVLHPPGLLDVQRGTQGRKGRERRKTEQSAIRRSTSYHALQTVADTGDLVHRRGKCNATWLS